MKTDNKFTSYSIIIVAIIICTIGLINLNKDNQKDSADPLSVQTYVLDNGLTIYLNEDHNTTSVFGAIAVRGGSKRDPKDATGIAHYLEHLLFKGTQEMGTIDYESEKIYLDSIELKYEDLGKTFNDAERLKIQEDINRLSIKASDYAIPNEFDRLIEGMGGSWVNAFTTNDAVVYLNKFPGDQIEKWLEVYSHRFVNPVFRLFQSELETVYEEKNRSMDNFFRQLFETNFKYFFKNHPYGQQTALGSVEHLKNPSLSKMKEYFDSYYVANNMALILTGDIHIDEIMPIIEEKFGNWEQAELAAPLNITEEDFNGRELVTANITPVKIGTMGFRTVPAKHEDFPMLEICKQLLTNESKTGLLDYLVVNGDIQDAGMWNLDYVDHGGSMLYFMPMQGVQSLDTAETLLISQLQKLKKGDFSEEFFNAVKLTMMRQHEASIESMEDRLFILIDTYIKEYDWQEVINWPQKLDGITKEDVLEVANKYFGDNYLVLHSNEGSPNKFKLEKPTFEPVVPKNAEASSVFAKRLSNIPDRKLNLQFIEFNKDVQFQDIQKNIHLYHTKNPINSIFDLTLQYGIGTLKIPELEQASELLNLLGTTNYSVNEFKAQLQKIGTTISFSADRDYFKINIKGFDKNIVESLEYVNEFIFNIKEDDSKINILVENAQSMRKMENETPSTIGEAIRDFTIWGDQSYYLRRLTVSEIANSKSSDYIQSFYNALEYELDILYTGRIDIKSLADHITSILVLPKKPKDSNSPIDLEIKNANKNLVYVIHDENAVQSQIYFNIVGNAMTEQSRNQSKAYNKYFSGGMSSIVFQEIREFRSLAYSAWGYFRRPWYNNNPGLFMGYIGCQADKTLESISVFRDITMNMPKIPERMEQVKSSLIKSINSDRPNFRKYPRLVSNWIKMGYINDPRKNQVRHFNRMLFSQIIDFQKNHIQGKPMVISILTDKNRINIDELNQYGEVIFLDKGDVLN